MRSAFPRTPSYGSSARRISESAVLTSWLQSFGTALLTQGENVVALAALNQELISRAEAVDRVPVGPDNRTLYHARGTTRESVHSDHFDLRGGTSWTVSCLRVSV